MNQVEAGKRTTIRIGPALAEAARAGVGGGADAALGDRIEAITARYLALVGDASALPAWPLDSWISVIAALRTLDASATSVVYALAGYLRAHKANTKVAYAAESLTPVQVHGLLVIAERLRDVPLEPAKMAEALAACGVKVLNSGSAPA